MRTIADDNNQLSRDDLGVELPARWLDRIFVINRDHSMAVAWRIHAPYMDLFSQGEIDGLHQAWRSLIHSLPENAHLQYIFESVSPRDPAFNRQFCRTATHPFLREVLLEKQRAMEEQFASGALRLMEGYVVVNIHTNPKVLDVEEKISEHINSGAVEKVTAHVQKTFGKKWQELVLKHFNPEQMGKIATESYLDCRKKAAEVADTVHLKLATMGLRPEPLEGDSAVDLLFRFNHPKSYPSGVRARSWSQSDLLPLSRYYLTGGANRDEDAEGYIVTDGAYHKILTVRNPPENIDFNIWNSILLYRGIHNARVIATLQRETIDSRKKYLKDRADTATMKAAKDDSYGIQASQITAALQDLGSGLESAWWIRCVVHVWGETKAIVDEQARRVIAAADDQEGLEIVPEDIAAWDYWCASQPYWTRQQDRHRDIPMVAREAVTLLPVVGQDTLLNRTVIGGLYETGTGSLFNFYLHSDKVVEFPNYNCLVCGGAGSGKTFMVNDLLAQMSALGAHIIAIDFKKPGSFRAMAQARGGNYIDFDLNSEKNCINPFSLPPGAKIDRDHLDSLIDNLCKRIADPAVNHGMVTEEQRSILERVLVEIMIQADGKPFIMEDFYNRLQKTNPELAKRLQPWVGTGRYAKLCNGPSNISLDNEFTVFDFEKITDNKHLCAVMFATVVTHAMNATIAKSGVPKFLVFDEAWEFFADPMMAIFIERAFRVLRAAGFSVIAISQGVEEFTKLPNKSAILNNVCHYVVLKQNSTEAAAALARELEFNEREVARAKALQVVSGSYSQALIVQKRSDGRRVSVVVNNRASPLAYWACTTRKHERDKLRNEVLGGKSYFQAIAEMAQKYPQGLML